MMKMILSTVLVSVVLYSLYLTSPNAQATKTEVAEKIQAEKPQPLPVKKPVEQKVQKSEASPLPDSTSSKSPVSESAPKNSTKTTAKKKVNSGELVLGNSAENTSDSTKTEVSLKQAIEGSKIFFEFNSYEISELAAAQLKAYALLLKKQPNATVQLSGFTDTSGNQKVNKAFSTARENSVKNKLLELGVQESQIEVTAPAKPTALSKVAAENRHVLLRIKK